MKLKYYVIQLLHIHTYVHTYIHTYVKHTFKYLFNLPPSLHTCIHNIHTYIHSYKHTYEHTYIHIYSQSTSSNLTYLCARFKLFVSSSVTNASAGISLMSGFSGRTIVKSGMLAYFLFIALISSSSIVSLNVNVCMYERKRIMKLQVYYNYVCMYVCNVYMYKYASKQE